MIVIKVTNKYSNIIFFRWINRHNWPKEQLGTWGGKSGIFVSFLLSFPVLSGAVRGNWRVESVSRVEWRWCNDSRATKYINITESKCCRLFKVGDRVRKWIFLDISAKNQVSIFKENELAVTEDPLCRSGSWRCEGKWRPDKSFSCTLQNIKSI
jgi:hypothetical protein